ncbi:YceI family protein [Parapedobacter koreensis]|uniref:Polyisoprenoid-binding protein YceI n=1 Tax=Parapedobacter koreensis TaxID=332977 RepID=A0A1H7LTZ4_9SPHI|nr:YceI family protein [Parapedobacter koreensis]SEL02329.1 Polyisoprenoid-binding protein YceI [Parapedobacter koreensis]
MRKLTCITVAALMFITSAFVLISAVNWQVKEEDYSIKFSTSKAEGVIKGLAGTINFDNSDLAQSNFDVTVDVSTLNTGNGLKNRHAKGEKFLDASNYPVIRFKTSQITRSSGGFVAKGKLTIKGVSRDVSIPFTFNTVGNDGTFTGNFEINRKDYGLEYKGVGEIIKIELLIPVNK